MATLPVKYRRTAARWTADLYAGTRSGWEPIGDHQHERTIRGVSSAYQSLTRVTWPPRRRLARAGRAQPFLMRFLVAALPQPHLLLAGIGVGICSSVIPYTCDQLAMARLPRSTFALMLSLLPASAAMIAVAVLQQIPTIVEWAAILLVMGGVALHKARDVHEQQEAPPG